ncbi:sensor histidine kinase [Azospirillum halopraeferens]|uniref:sensor histidine kinase n=1 Tax=Azospirillum halopraeferens TaxID=34010 RepID=UPI0004133A7C|nr:HAMP domain-containing sensor histidine kinase [Azospirillum halopraeferens]
MTPFPKLLRTTTFRLALLYLGMFGASVTVILWVVWRTTAGFMEQQVADAIAADIALLRQEYQFGGLPRLIATVRDRSNDPHTNAMYLVLSPHGVPLAGNLSGWPKVMPEQEGWMHFQVAPSGGPHGQPATASAQGFVLPGGLKLLVGRDMSVLDTLRHRMVASLGWVVAVTGALGVAGGLLLSRRALARIEAINRTTRRIIDGDLADRVPRTGSGDEIDRLAANLNTMLDQIVRLMEGMRHVSESVAHDLRTPLTRLRSRLELVLIEDTDDPEVYRTALQETIGEADALLATFRALLSIAEAEAGGRAADFQPVDLAAIARTAADLYEPVAEEKGLTFTADVPDAPVPARGNPQLLSQALANLLDNAIKYTPAGGRIALRVDGAAGRLEVADSGPGIPADLRERVLERFVRLDDARATPGNGLGLALVDAVARLHGARLELGDAAPGLSIALTLPPAAEGGGPSAPASRAGG